MKTPYEVAAGFAVQIRRMANGLYGQTKYTKFLESIERLPDDELKRLQAVKLCSLLRYSIEKVPYYKQFKGMFKLTEDSVYDDILQFPIISRDIMAEFNEKLRVPGEPYIIELKSGGTTNRRIKVLRDKPALTDRNDEYFNKILGIFPGMTRLILNRHENHYYDKEENEIEFEFNKLTRTYLVNPTFFGEKKLKITYDILMNKKPKIIRGNSTFIYEFAKAIEDRGWKSRHVPLIE
ncbi:MAG: hypothetical protein R3232_12200, partial [Clostridia bacterium]|nr:hypothetical protein [Clostridia bacterium]